MFCYNCAAALSSNANFCSHCAAPVAFLFESEESSSSASANELKILTKSPKDTLKPGNPQSKRTFVIRENNASRFHVVNFGVDVCGKNGELVFDLIIADRLGNEIQKIKDVSISDLFPNADPDGEHKRENKYRVTDYLAWENGLNGQTVVGKTRAAKLLLSKS